MTATEPSLTRNVLRIRQLNDSFRTTLTGGRVVMTAGINSLPVETVTEILKAVVTFDSFSPDNDPYGEHDFGAIEIEGYRMFWKIDYYDLKMEYGSPDPADSSETTRVMTIMLASEY